MTRKKPRHLTSEERDLWARVAQTATPLTTPFAAKPKVPASTVKRKTLAPDPIQPFKLGSRAQTSTRPHDLRPDLSDEISSAKLAMDKKAHKKMVRGKLKPEGRIDLHGMTVDRAHGALSSFVLSAQSSGKRLVLVITGKGRRVDDNSPIPTRTGVLRHQVPRWLSTPPLSSAVLQITEAHQRHGGSGAFYVYLRRS